MKIIIALFAVVAVVAVAIARADNKKQKAREIVGGAGLLAGVLLKIGAFIAGAFVGLLQWAKRNGG